MWKGERTHLSKSSERLASGFARVKLDISQCCNSWVFLWGWLHSACSWTGRHAVAGANRRGFMGRCTRTLPILIKHMRRRRACLFVKSVGSQVAQLREDAIPTHPQRGLRSETSGSSVEWGGRQYGFCFPTGRQTSTTKHDGRWVCQRTFGMTVDGGPDVQARRRGFADSRLAAAPQLGNP